MGGKESDGFEKLTNKHAKMKYTEHEILYNTWVEQEQQRRKPVVTSKPTRQIDSSGFGQANMVRQQAEFKPDQVTT
jgi:hypothetical protein